MKVLVLIFLLLLPLTLVGQHDTLWVKNGNVLYGEIKGLSSGILKMETPYSDDDFTIDYSEVERISIERQCLIIATGGIRIVGFIKSEKQGQVTITEQGKEPSVYSLKYITQIQQVKNNFWNRFNANIDVGFNLTKANNQRQLNIGGGIHYRGFKWFSDFDISSLVANQDSVQETQRTNVNLTALRMLNDRWYTLASGSFLSNTEQNLKGRYGGRFGAGRFLANNERLLFGISIGLNFNVENFQDESQDRESLEAYISTNLNMFDFKDFSLKTRIDVYPSISEGGRIRIDYILNAKYDLPYDFYIKGELQFNYDNQVAEGGSPFDYILTSGFGWSFD